MHLIEIEDLALPELQIYRTLRGITAPTKYPNF